MLRFAAINISIDGIKSEGCWDYNHLSKGDAACQEPGELRGDGERLYVTLRYELSRRWEGIKVRENTNFEVEFVLFLRKLLEKNMICLML